MSSPYSPATTPITPNRRPATIAELAEAAHIDLWDATKGLKHWLRTAERSRKAGKLFHDQGNWEAAFVEYARAATLVLDKLPTHREYSTLLSADQRHNLSMNGQELLEYLSELKPKLINEYDDWVGRYGQPDPSIPTFLSIAKEETAVRKAEEQRARYEPTRQDSRRERRADDRRIREGSPWLEQSEDARRREVGSSDMGRADRSRDVDEEQYNLQAERLRREEDARSYEAQRTRRNVVEEKRQYEQEGILRRQAESDAAARAVRRDIAHRMSPAPAIVVGRMEPDIDTRPGTPPVRMMPVAAPHPSRPSNSTQFGDPRQVPSIMSLESPTRYDYDSSTDVEGKTETPWQRPGQQEPPPPRRLGNGLRYDPPVTTTSPAPPDLRVDYPSIMSSHQRNQGYVPSLQSMFSNVSLNDPGPDSSLLFDARPSTADLYSNILPKPSSAVQAASQYRHGMPVADPHPYQYTTQHVGQRVPPPGGARPPPPIPPKEPLAPPPAPMPAHVAPRIVPSTSKEPTIRDLKTVRLPRECLPKFVSIARVNTLQNRETCGLLLGKDKGSKYVVSTLLIPKQRSTSDTCTMDEEELVLQFTEERHLITLGWIHTHPTQSCFMSSVDLHTHSGFQRMLPESFAVVCAPQSKPMFGIFRLTDPGGLQTILACDAKEAFHPHPPVPIYTDCDNSHVQMKDIPIEIVDLR
ncbi:hypothetical protein EIP91_002831 [Steccherinum ochraceum]|uniref:MPN domain-containing protein n=1 Tax=Steccherinum ochraceum TaxID=92696 RepID=A0A4R0RDY0_9APHY|nr:hypothetical protein EIP91_002831 [Steccherinum ochraceum]